MQNHGDKFLLGFLGFSLLVCVLAVVYRANSLGDLSGNGSNTEPDTSIVRSSVDAKNEDSSNMGSDALSIPSLMDAKNEDSSNMGSDALSIPSLMDTQTILQAVLQKVISLESYNLRVEPTTHWKLPGRLREISGLAMTMDNRLLAHNDEKAVIYEIDYRNGEIVKAFQLADMADPVAGDFEGIATVDDKVYLITSSGRLYECGEGADGESVLFNVYATGVGRDYEIEGLAYDASQRALLLMCKDSRRKELKEQLIIYHWSTDEKQLIEDAHIVISVLAFVRYIGGMKFQPSGIELHPISGNYFVVAARQRAIAEITPDGQVVAAKLFPTEWHRQTEGIAFAVDGTLIIADEGAGKKARLSLYPVLERRQ